MAINSLLCTISKPSQKAVVYDRRAQFPSLTPTFLVRLTCYIQYTSAYLTSRALPSFFPISLPPIFITSSASSYDGETRRLSTRTRTGLSKRLLIPITHAHARRKHQAEIFGRTHSICNSFSCTQLLFFIFPQRCMGRKIMV